MEDLKMKLKQQAQFSSAICFTPLQQRAEILPEVCFSAQYSSYLMAFPVLEIFWEIISQVFMVYCKESEDKTKMITWLVMLANTSTHTSDDCLQKSVAFLHLSHKERTACESLFTVCVTRMNNTTNCNNSVSSETGFYCLDLNCDVWCCIYDMHIHVTTLVGWSRVRPGVSPTVYSLYDNVCIKMLSGKSFSTQWVSVCVLGWACSFFMGGAGGSVGRCICVLCGVVVILKMFFYI